MENIEEFGPEEKASLVAPKGLLAYFAFLALTSAQLQPDPSIMFDY